MSATTGPADSPLYRRLLTLRESRQSLCNSSLIPHDINDFDQLRISPTHGFRLKKSLHAAEQDRPDVAAARKALRKEQPTLDPKKLVFIDETAATTKMTRLSQATRKANGLLIRCRTATGKQLLSHAGCA